MKSAKKILCIQLRQLGDVLMTTPSVRALSEHYPDAEIDFLTEAPGDQIYEHNPHINRVIRIKRKNSAGEWLKLASKLRKSSYDIVIDFIGMPKTAILGWLSGAPKRIGFNFRGRTFFYTNVVDLPKDVNYAPLHKMQLLSVLGLISDDSSIEFHLADKDRSKAGEILKQVGAKTDSPIVTVSPVSRREYKVWPPGNFAAICDHLVRRYKAQILFLWGPGEYSFIQEVRNAMHETSLPDYDIPTLRETTALCELADLHIGNDNGPMHFAIAAGTPTVAIFGQPSPANWTPPESEKNLAVEFDPGCKRNCRYPDCKMECIKELPVEDVMSAVEAQIGRIGGKFKKGDDLT